MYGDDNLYYVMRVMKMFRWKIISFITIGKYLYLYGYIWVVSSRIIFFSVNQVLIPVPRFI